MSDLVLGIVGSRVLEGNDRAYRIIHEYLSALRPGKVVSGGARGIDRMGVEVALGMGYSEDQIIWHLPEPRSTSRWDYIAACFARNTLIVDDSTDVLAIMVPGGSSGTLDTVKKARDRGVSAYIIYVESAENEKCIHCGMSPNLPHTDLTERNNHFFD